MPNDKRAYAEGANGLPYPAYREHKFTADGRALPFAGNTVICPVPPDSQTFAALLEIHRQLSGQSFSHKLAILPPASYHMTVFSGADEAHRTPGLWPAGVPLDAPMAVCTAALAERFKGLCIDEEPFRVQIDDSEPDGRLWPCMLELSGVNTAEEARLRQFRDRLSDAFGIRAPDHDSYRFHITLAYQLAWFTPEENTDYGRCLRAWQAAIKASISVIELANPRFFTFETMLDYNYAN